MGRKVMVTIYSDPDVPHKKAFAFEGEGQALLTAQEIFDAMIDALFEDYGFIPESDAVLDPERYDA